MINIEFTPKKEGILANSENTFEVLVRASSDKELPSEYNKRLPLNLSMVIDRSGSMGGQPLEEAKKCAAMLVDRMNANDRLSLVTYDHDVDVLFPPTKVVHKHHLKNQIEKIEARGLTALYDGWSAGAEQVAQHSDENCLSRVLLLSDGLANDGVVDQETITSHCQTMAENNVTTSTYGLGQKFNENLMTAMAHSGQGQSHYGQTADDLMDPFQEEFDLLEALLARQLRLRIIPEFGVSFELLNGYTQDQEGRFIIPDLAYGADIWALLKIKVNKNQCEQALGTSIKVLTATIDFFDEEGVAQRTEPAVMKIELHPQSTFAELALDENVTQRSIELRAATLQEQAQIAARRDDWVRVDQIMAELEELGADNAWIKASVRQLRAYSSERQRESFSKEARYTSTKMRSRRVARSETYGSYDASAEKERPSYLRRKLEQGKKQL